MWGNGSYWLLAYWIFCILDMLPYTCFCFGVPRISLLWCLANLLVYIFILGHLKYRAYLLLSQIPSLYMKTCLKKIMECKGLKSKSVCLLTSSDHSELWHQWDHQLQAERWRLSAGHGSPCKESWSHQGTQFEQEKRRLRHWCFTEDSSDFVEAISSLTDSPLPLFPIFFFYWTVIVFFKHISVRRKGHKMSIIRGLGNHTDGMGCMNREIKVGTK